MYIDVILANNMAILSPNRYEYNVAFKRAKKMVNAFYCGATF